MFFIKQITQTINITLVYKKKNYYIGFKKMLYILKKRVRMAISYDV